MFMHSPTCSNGSSQTGPGCAQRRPRTSDVRKKSWPWRIRAGSPIFFATCGRSASMASNEAPRVAFVGGVPIGFPNATGQTLASLYAEYPESRILQLVTEEGTSPSRGDVVRWPRSTVPLDAAARGARRILHRTRAAADSADGLNDAT